VRVQTRAGRWVTVPDELVVKQVKVVKRRDTFYVLHLRNGSQIATNSPVDSVPIELKEDEPVEVAPESTAIPWRDRELPSADSAPSANTGKMVAGKNVDYHAAEKYKGETFFTHKTAPGLVIKNPDGNIRHETKMSDMYKRRD